MKTFDDRRTIHLLLYLLRVALPVLMFLFGALLAAEAKGEFWRRGGFAFCVAGTTSFFTELIFERLRPDRLKELAEKLQQPVMRMLAEERCGCSRYLAWYVNTEPQKLLFAGRSILHRIQADFRVREFKDSVELALLRKLRESCHIKILLLDPRWDQIPVVAREERKDPGVIYGNLSASLGVIERLARLLLQNRDIPGRLQVCFYTHLTQYAFQWTQNIQTKEREMLVGLYFADREGLRSPLFEVEDPRIENEFLNHFNSILDRSLQDPTQALLTFEPLGPTRTFNEHLFQEVKDYLNGKLPGRVEGIMEAPV